MDAEEAKKLCTMAASIVGNGCTGEQAAAAAEMFRRVADAGYPDGQFGLAEMMFNGIGMPRDIKASMDLYRKAADAGNIPALFRLGGILAEVEEFADPKGAFDCMKRCAEARFPPAFGVLGDMFYYGHGTESDPSQAINWYRLASAAGDPGSMFKVACMCRSGMGTEKDDEAADAMFMVSAQAGIPEAMFEVAHSMYSGRMGGDKAEAARWYEKCADAIPTAKFNLAAMCLIGDGIPKDPKRAFRLYREVAESSGDKDALFQVGRMLLEGLGTEQDSNEGFHYLVRAADAGNEDAAAIVNGLRRRMNSQIVTIDGTEGQVEEILKDRKG